MLGTQAQPHFKARWPHGGKAQHCLGCGGDIVQVGRTIRCDACAGKAGRRQSREWQQRHSGYNTREARRLRKERKETTP